MLALRDVVTLGILRELHRWGAHAMVITIWLHMYRVFLTEATSRRGNLTGRRRHILVLNMLLSFTLFAAVDQLAILGHHRGQQQARATPFLGYEGPAPPCSRWADAPLIHSGSDARFILLGGRFVSGIRCLRFYVLHCVAIPLAVAC